MVTDDRTDSFSITVFETSESAIKAVEAAITLDIPFTLDFFHNITNREVRQEFRLTLFAEWDIDEVDHVCTDA